MVDFFKYAGQPASRKDYDYGRGFRALAQQRLQESRLEEDKRQANMHEQGVQSRHTENLGFNRENLDSTNDRFAVGVADEERAKQYEVKLAKKKQSDQILKEFNDAVVKTDFNRADSMLGQMQSLGFKVDRKPGPNGNPIYRAEPPEFDTEMGEIDASGIRGQIGNGDSGASGLNKEQSQSFNQEPSSLFQEKNPFDSLPGESATRSQSHSQSHSIEEDQPFGSQPEANDIFTPPTDIQSTQSEQPPVASTPEPKNPFDPYQLDTSAMLEQNRKRIDPMLGGLINATPGRFRDRMGAFTGGVRQMGLPLDQTMETMQKPMDTIAGLMKSEMGADAASQRINVTMGGQAANRNIRLEDRMWRRMDQIGKSFDLAPRKIKMEKVHETINHLGQNNPSADGLMVSSIRNMFENGVMTDKDFANTKEGIKTIFQQIRDGVDEKLITGGLNPDSRAGLTAFLKQIVKDDVSAVSKAQQQLLTQAQRAGSEEELKTVYDYIAGNIPQHLWADEVKEEYGIPVDRKSGAMDQSGNYGTKKSPKTGTPPASISLDVNSEVEGLLDGD